MRDRDGPSSLSESEIDGASAHVSHAALPARVGQCARGVPLLGERNVMDFVKLGDDEERSPMPGERHE